MMLMMMVIGEKPIDIFGMLLNSLCDYESLASFDDTPNSMELLAHQNENKISLARTTYSVNLKRCCFESEQHERMPFNNSENEN